MNHRLHRRMTTEYMQGLRQIKTAAIGINFNQEDRFKNLKPFKTIKKDEKGQEYKQYTNEEHEYLIHGTKIRPKSPKKYMNKIISAKIGALRSETNSAVNRLNLLKRRSKKVKMAQINPNVEKVLSQLKPTSEAGPLFGSLLISPSGKTVRGEGNHYDIVRKYSKELGIKIGKPTTAFGEGSEDYVDDSHIHEFLQKTGTVRVQQFPHLQKYSIHIAGRLNNTQIKTIQRLEESEPNTTLGFAVGPDFDNMDFGEGFNNFMKSYRKHFGQKGAQAEGETNVFNMTYTKSKPHKVKKRYYGDKV